MSAILSIPYREIDTPNNPNEVDLPQFYREAAERLNLRAGKLKADEIDTMELMERVARYIMRSTDPRTLN